MATSKNCSCGAPECWADGDYTWLDERAGWRGTVDGMEASIYWIHGKKIAEERHIRTFSLSMPEFHALLARLCAGLVAPMIHWSVDTGGGDCALWIRDVRDPVEADWQRLREAREAQLQRDRRDLASLQRRIEANPARAAVDPHATSTGTGVKDASAE